MNMLPNGTNRCQCPACGLYFGGVSAFDDHRVGVAGDRRCLSQPEMSEKGMRQDQRGYWGRDYRPSEDEPEENPMWGEESWSAPQDPGHSRAMKWGGVK